MDKAIFLDRDGTLNVDEKGYTHKEEDYELHAGVLDGLKKLNRHFQLFIVSNQSGIGRGYYTEEDFHNFNKVMLEELGEHKIHIDGIFFCPHTPDQVCDCRKPSTKHIKEVEKSHNIDPKKSFVIGDHSCDIEMGKSAGCKSIYLLTGHGVKYLEEARKQKPDYIAANFLQAADFILFKREDKIIDRKKIKEVASSLREKGKTIVTLNGTFDILHKGHDKIIKEAKQQGDILIIGLNSDSSVRRYKREGRPLNNQIKRAKMLATKQHVDYVFIFDEDTPIPFLEEIKPDVHVNGSEYGEKCIEADTVRKYGRLHVVKLLEGHSSTMIIEGK